MPAASVAWAVARAREADRWAQSARPQLEATPARPRQRRATVGALTAALASELRSGQTPDRAWHSVLRGLGGTAARSLRPRRDVVTVLNRWSRVPGWGGLAAVAICWRVADSTGVGLADALDRIGEAMRHEYEVASEVDGQLASVRATASVLATLPAGRGRDGPPPGGQARSRCSWGRPSGAACLAVGVGARGDRLVVAHPPGRVGTKDSPLVTRVVAGGCLHRRARRRGLAAGDAVRPGDESVPSTARSTPRLLSLGGSAGCRRWPPWSSWTVSWGPVSVLFWPSSSTDVREVSSRRARSRARGQTLAGASDSGRGARIVPGDRGVSASRLCMRLPMDSVDSLADDFSRVAGALGVGADVAEAWSLITSSDLRPACGRAEPRACQRCPGSPAAVVVGRPAPAAGQSRRHGCRTHARGSVDRPTGPLLPAGFRADRGRSVGAVAAPSGRMSHPHPCGRRVVRSQAPSRLRLSPDATPCGRDRPDRPNRPAVGSWRTHDREGASAPEW